MGQEVLKCMPAHLGSPRKKPQLEKEQMWPVSPDFSRVCDGLQHALHQQVYKSLPGSVFCLVSFYLQIAVISDTNPT